MGATTGHGWRLPDQTTQPPDVVAWLGNLGNDIDADVTDLEAVVDSHTAALVKLGLAGKRVIFASAVSGVSASGGATFTFGHTFTAPPVVLPVLGDESGTFFAVQLVHSSVTTTQFAVRVLKHDGTIATSGNVRVNFAAAGPSAATAELLPAPDEEVQR